MAKTRTVKEVENVEVTEVTAAVGTTEEVTEEAKEETRETTEEANEKTEETTKEVTEEANGKTEETKEETEKVTEEIKESKEEDVYAPERRERTYTKQSFLRFPKYGRYRDLLAAVLDDNKRYSITEVDNILKEDE